MMTQEEIDEVEKTFPPPVRDFVVRRKGWKAMTDEEVEAALAEPEPEEDPDC